MGRFGGRFALQGASKTKACAMPADADRWPRGRRKPRTTGRAFAVKGLAAL